jgi:prepilin-type processing-associated H-X9-DG protein
VTIGMITDGTSNTAAWSEKVKGIGYKTNDNGGNQNPDPLSPSTTIYMIPSGGGTGYLTDFSNGAMNQGDLYTVYQQCQSSSTPYTTQGSGGAVRVVGQQWWYGNYWAGGYNHLMPPNSKLCTAGNDNYDVVAYGALSRHPGGVNVCMADGSVRFIKQTIAYNIWWALGTRAGGEVLSADQF